MVGTSRRQFSTFYSDELAGAIESNWGEDVMVTLDDKLHMSEQTTVQEVKGPLNFSKVATFTVAGPLNATSTETNVFAGPIDLNNTLNVENTATFQSTIVTPNSNNLSNLLTAEVTQLGLIGTATIDGNQWGYLGNMDQNVNTGTSVVFSDTTVGNFFFKDGTAYACQLAHAATAARTWTLPNISGTVAMWDVDNAVKTRYFCLTTPSATEGTVTFLTTYIDNILGSGNDAIYDIHIPDGAIITDMYIVTSSGGGTTDMDVLIREYDKTAGWATKATNTMTNIGNPTTETLLAVTDFTVDGSRFYYIYIENCDGAVSIRGFRVKYTQTQV